MLDLVCVLVEYQDEAFALFHGDGDGLLQAAAVLLADLQFVNDHLDVVIFIAIHFHAAYNFLHLSVYPDVQIAFAAHRLEKFAVVTLSAAYQRSQDENLVPIVVVQDHVEHLFLSIFHHLLARHVAICLSGSGKEQTHVVVYFGSGADGGARIAVGGLLVYADDGRESCYLVHVRTFHASQEVAGVG